jgi:hypothetical protein
VFNAAKTGCAKESARVRRCLFSRSNSSPLKVSHMSVVKVVVDFAVRALSASAVMTVSQHIEIRLTHRPESDLPVRVIETFTRRSIPRGVNSVVAGQLVQGMLAAAAIAQARLTKRSPTAPAVLAGVLFLVSFNAIVLRVLGLGDMPWRWSKQELGTDVLHKSSLAVAATTLTRRGGRVAENRPITAIKH